MNAPSLVERAEARRQAALHAERIFEPHPPHRLNVWLLIAVAGCAAFWLIVGAMAYRLIG